MEGVKLRPRSLVRLRVQHVRGGPGWELSDNGVRIKTVNEWSDAMHQADKIASRWRSHYAAWLW